MKSDHELQSLRNLKKVVYEVLQEYEFLDPSDDIEDRVCVPLRTILSLSRAYAAIGLCHDE